MKSLTKAINITAHIFDHFNNFGALLAKVLLAFLVLSITFTVVTRYFFNFVPKGLFEIWEYCLLWIPFLGAAWLLKREGHVDMDILLTHVKPKVQIIINTITSVLCTITCLALTWFSALTTLKAYQSGIIQIRGELFMPEYIILIIIPIGSALLFVQFLRRTCGFVRNWRALT